MNKIIIRILILVIITAVVGTFGHLNVNAVSCSSTKYENYYGRDRWYGYFLNRCDDGGQSVLPEVFSTSGKTFKVAIPDGVNNVDSLIGFLKDYNSGTNKSGYNSSPSVNTAWKKTGSAFIVNTMLGYNGPGVGKDISQPTWDQLYIRLKARSDLGKINWRVSAAHCNFANSFYQNGGSDGVGPDDVAFQWKSGCVYNPDTSLRQSIVVYDDNNSITYELLRFCANPIGILPGLPPAPQNWSLTPSVTLNPTNYIEAGASFNVTSTVNNTGEVASGSVAYNLEKKVGSGAYSTYSTYSGTRTFPLSPNPTYITNSLSFSDTDYDAGTQICFRLSVTPRSNTISSTLSSEDCVVIGKKPKVQVWGGDLWVRGNIQTSSSVKNSRMYGSWDEYALFAGGRITGMASGSAIAAGLASYSDVCNYSKLTFANAPAGLINSCSNDTLNKGYYDTASRLIPDVASSFPTTNSNPTISTTSITNAGGLNGLSSGVYRASNTSAININLPSTISSGKWIVINVPDNDININYDISYVDGPYNRISQIPQVIIIAKNINIHNRVTGIDAWLIAPGGLIKTCDIAVDARQTVNSCRNLLTINGPIMTDNLYLLRTAGSGTGANSGDPAEIINLRADAYLWAYSRTLGQGRVRTVHTRELPPRF